MMDKDRKSFANFLRTLADETERGEVSEFRVHDYVKTRTVYNPEKIPAETEEPAYLEIQINIIKSALGVL